MAEPATPGIVALILMGVSGSGKSSVAEALAARIGWRFADGDTFHPPANVAKMSAGTPLTDDDRWPWLRAIAAEIDRVGAAGGHIIIACSALKRAYRDILVHGRANVRIVYLEGSRDLIAARLKARKDHFMPAGLLDSQIGALQPPSADEHALTVSVDQDIPAIVDAIMRGLALDAAPRATA